MFRKNESYRQQSIFGIESMLSKKQQKLWKGSIEHKFFEQIFANIDEDCFSVLYSKKRSRPNVPINQLVGALILKHLNDWTYAELFNNLNFNILTRYAIGIHGVGEDIFAEASIYNFQNRVIQHYSETGVDLLEQVFDNLTAQQLKEFDVKTSIQRGDSFLIGSYIFDFNRLHLLIEVLLRLKRMLDTKDKKLFEFLLSPYSQKTAGQYMYKVKKENLPKEYDLLSQVYHQLYTAGKEKYRDQQVFKIFERVYTENFAMVDERITVVPANKMTSSILMSPDDEEATYRKKGPKFSKGYVGHLSETAHPDNEINLITDVATYPNNIGDAQILEERLPRMHEKTPEIKEYFSDGMYGSPGVDNLTQQYGIIQYQTAVRGRKSGGQIRILKEEDGSIWVSCGGGQKVRAEKQRRWKAIFNYEKCKNCPLAQMCRASISGLKRGIPKRTYYFYGYEILRHKRLSNYHSLPEEKKTLRANVEATVKEEKRGMKNGKVRVRGKMRVTFYLIFTSIAINLTRIHRICGEITLKAIPVLSQATRNLFFNIIGQKILRYHAN